MKTLQLIEVGGRLVAVDATADQVDAIEYGERIWTARGTVEIVTMDEAATIARAAK